MKPGDKIEVRRLDGLIGEIRSVYPMGQPTTIQIGEVGAYTISFGGYSGVISTQLYDVLFKPYGEIEIVQEEEVIADIKYDEMTIEGLKDIAKDLGLKVKANAKKTDLIELIKSKDINVKVRG